MESSDQQRRTIAEVQNFWSKRGIGVRGDKRLLAGSCVEAGIVQTETITAGANEFPSGRCVSTLSRVSMHPVGHLSFDSATSPCALGMSRVQVPPSTISIAEWPPEAMQSTVSGIITTPSDMMRNAKKQETSFRGERVTLTRM
jgi:hypothetical protein